MGWRDREYRQEFMGGKGGRRRCVPGSARHCSPDAHLFSGVQVLMPVRTWFATQPTWDDRDVDTLLSLVIKIAGQILIPAGAANQRIGNVIRWGGPLPEEHCRTNGGQRGEVGCARQSVGSQPGLSAVAHLMLRSPLGTAAGIAVYTSGLCCHRIVCKSTDRDKFTGVLPEAETDQQTHCELTSPETSRGGSGACRDPRATMGRDGQSEMPKMND